MLPWAVSATCDEGSADSKMSDGPVSDSRHFSSYLRGDGQALSPMNAGAVSFSILRCRARGHHRAIRPGGQEARVASPAMVRNVME